MTVAVPDLPTTIPAAMLANRIESERLRPPASPAAMLAITVSPDPETSKTSLASVGKSSLITFPFLLQLQDTQHDQHAKYQNIH